MRGRAPSPRRSPAAPAVALVVAIAILAAACAPMLEPPGPPIEAPHLADGVFIAADGARLPMRSWLPNPKPPQAVVIAVHGFNDYSNFFEDPGTYLASRGVASYAYDQRGFGAAPHHGFWPGVRALADDLDTFVRLIRARHRGLPLYLLGVSMGGAVVMVAVTGPGAPPVDGVILAAPAVWGRDTMPWYQTLALSIAAHTVPWLKLSGRRLGRMPSDNIEMLKKLGKDPLIIKETRVDALYGVVNLMDAALASSARLDVRTLILYGLHDEIIPKTPTYLMVHRLPKADRDRRRVAIYKKGYHMLLRDLEAKVVWRDIAAWIADADAPLPSGADAEAARLLAGN